MISFYFDGPSSTAARILNVNKDLSSSEDLCGNDSTYSSEEDSSSNILSS